jgi:hypothetical protein
MFRFLRNTLPPTPLRDRIDLAARVRNTALVLLADQFRAGGTYAGRDDDAIYIAYHGANDCPRTVRITITAQEVSR